MEEDVFEPRPPDLPSKEFGQDETVNKIIVVRHAESQANGGGIYQGQSHDTDLSELGVKQAKALAQRMKSFSTKRIISSPLRRTYQTALEISKIIESEIEVRSEIIETNHGEWEGKSKEWILANYQDLYELWLDQPSQAAFPDGEHFGDTVRRVEKFLNESKFDNDTVIVSHDNIVRVITALANKDDIDTIWSYNIEPAALNIFEVNQVGGVNQLRALKINDIEHLGSLRADLRKHAL